MLPFLFTKKTGYKRELPPIPIFKIIEMYRLYIKGKTPFFENYKVVFQQIHLEPQQKNEDEFKFSESDHII